MTEGHSVTQQTHATVGAPVESDATNDKGRIVVGVDGSPGSLTALGWAVDEARQRGTSLQVVMTWQMPQTYGSPTTWGAGMDPSLDAKNVLAKAADDEAARLRNEVVPDDVPTTWEVVQGHPAWKLIDVSKGAELLVVGSRGHGGFVGALLGSVSQYVVTHAACPVVVVPDPQRAAPDQHTGSGGTSYQGGVFDQAHQHLDHEPGQGVYEQGHADREGQGVYDQGQAEVGEGVFDQGRPVPEDV
jgi:nucleotide-binding universal stress UspA family protein